MSPQTFKFAETLAYTPPITLCYQDFCQFFGELGVWFEKKVVYLRLNYAGVPGLALSTTFRGVEVMSGAEMIPFVPDADNAGAGSHRPNYIRLISPDATHFTLMQVFGVDVSLCSEFYQV